MRHPLHSICPYFAMFPEDFVTKQLLAFTNKGDQVFDPFSGRGTTVFESLLRGRQASGTDINSVAACVAGAKADAPLLAGVEARLQELQASFKRARKYTVPAGDFFRACFHGETLQEILHLRRNLKWKTSKKDRFIAAVVLGVLHGESHKTENCLSNRMPRTISTKPDYSVRWWREKGCLPPKRDAFEIVGRLIKFRLAGDKAPLKGKVALRDARRAGNAFPELTGKVDLIVTSPPYLDTTDYAEDQWLRLWFLGGPERPQTNAKADDRHTSKDDYWEFLSDAWYGCASLVRRGTTIVVRIGGASLSKGDILDGLTYSIEEGFEDFKARLIDGGQTTEIINRQTNAFRPGTVSKRFEHDFTFVLS